MGITADLQNVGSLDSSLNATANQRVMKAYVDNLIDVQGDPAYLARDAVKTEVQSIAQHVPTISGGTFALTVKLFSGETFTTAVIVYEASAATIETAIDVAATAASITGWTNGDITVAGGHLNTAAVTLTFDGASVVSQKHFLTVIDGALLTGGGSAGVVSVTTDGQPNRPALATMNLIGLIGDTQPIGNLPVSADYVGVQGSLHLNPNELVLRMLATEAGIETGDIGVGSEAVRDEHLALMRGQGFAV